MGHACRSHLSPGCAWPLQFTRHGLKHYELFFPDGTPPPEAQAKRFLKIAETEPGVIAVHCKAGLGRTGTLILMWAMKHFKLTAKEAIGYLRVARPGSIIGPQQQFLSVNEKRLWRMGGHSLDANDQRPTTRAEETEGRPGDVEHALPNNGVDYRQQQRPTTMDGMSGVSGQQQRRSGQNAISTPVSQARSIRASSRNGRISRGSTGLGRSNTSFGRTHNRILQSLQVGGAGVRGGSSSSSRGLSSASGSGYGQAGDGKPMHHRLSHSLNGARQLAKLKQQEQEAAKCQGGITGGDSGSFGGLGGAPEALTRSMPTMKLNPLAHSRTSSSGGLGGGGLRGSSLGGSGGGGGGGGQAPPRREAFADLSPALSHSTLGSRSSGSNSRSGQVAARASSRGGVGSVGGGGHRLPNRSRTPGTLGTLSPYAKSRATSSLGGLQGLSSNLSMPALGVFSSGTYERSTPM
jgi:hypothetical protein